MLDSVSQNEQKTDLKSPIFIPFVTNMDQLQAKSDISNQFSVHFGSPSSSVVCVDNIFLFSTVWYDETDNPARTVAEMSD